MEMLVPPEGLPGTFTKGTGIGGLGRAGPALNDPNGLTTVPVVPLTAGDGKAGAGEAAEPGWPDPVALLAPLGSDFLPRLFFAESFLTFVLSLVLAVALAVGFVVALLLGAGLEQAASDSATMTIAMVDWPAVE